jgi:hypothetical protein
MDALRDGDSQLDVYALFVLLLGLVVVNFLPVGTTLALVHLSVRLRHSSAVDLNPCNHTAYQPILSSTRRLNRQYG